MERSVFNNEEPEITVPVVKNEEPVKELVDDSPKVKDYFCSISYHEGKLIRTVNYIITALNENLARVFLADKVKKDFPFNDFSYYVTVTEKGDKKNGTKQSKIDKLRTSYSTFLKAQELKESIKKYFVTFRINVKGERKDVGVIISDTDEESALENAKIKIKRDFSGIRSFTFPNVRIATKNDKNFVKPVVENIPKSDKSSNDIDLEKVDTFSLDKLYSSLDENEPVYKVIYTPGRKPRLRDYDKSFILVQADDLNNAWEKAESIFDSMGLGFKKSWCVILEGTLKSFKSSIEKKLKEIKEESGFDINSLEDFVPKSFNEPVVPKIKEERISVEGVTASYNDDFVIGSVHPEGVSFVDSLKLNKYEMVLNTKDSSFPKITVVAESEISGAAFLFSVIKRNKNFVNVYKDVVSIDCTDLKTGKTSFLRTPSIID